MPNYITTYTGKHFFPTAPEKDLLDPRDIARSLSLQCRGNGQVTGFFSVAQHCIKCANEAAARGYSDRMVFALLLHDAIEAYMSDIPRPFKHELPQLIEWEDNLLTLVYEKFLGSDLTEEEQKALKEVDDALLYYDVKYLLKEEMKVPVPTVHVEINYDFVPFETVEKEYLKMFNDLYKKVRGTEYIFE